MIGSTVRLKSDEFQPLAELGFPSLAYVEEQLALISEIPLEGAVLRARVTDECLALELDSRATGPLVVFCSDGEHCDGRDGATVIRVLRHDFEAAASVARPLISGLTAAS